MNLTIPAELVPALRDVLSDGLDSRLEAADGLVEPEDRQADRADPRLARAEADRRLLDVVGWFEPEEGPPPVVVDVSEHREALLRALLTCVEGEGDAGKAGQFAALVQRVEEVEAGPAAQR
jgi:hypothetical protein